MLKSSFFKRYLTVQLFILRYLYLFYCWLFAFSDLRLRVWKFLQNLYKNYILWTLQVWHFCMLALIIWFGSYYSLLISFLRYVAWEMFVKLPATSANLEYVEGKYGFISFLLKSVTASLRVTKNFSKYSSDSLGQNFYSCLLTTALKLKSATTRSLKT